MYQSTVFPQSLPLAMSLISSTILQPKLTPLELETQKDAAAYEVREIWQKPELILPEILHSVAFKDNTLGMPLLCPESQLDVLGEKEVRGFMKDWFKPERMVVAGVGMQHEELVELAEKEFGVMVPGNQPSTSASTSTLHSLLFRMPDRTSSRSWQERERRILEASSISRNPMKNLSISTSDSRA
jgi:processing peptidase subunit alpha